MNVPQLRFKGFEAEWNIEKLSNLGEFKRSYSFSRSSEGKGRYRHLHYGDIHSKFNGILTKVDRLPTIVEKKDFEVIQSGDVVFADASEDYKDLGKAVAFENISTQTIIAGLHTHLFRPYENIDGKFLMYFTKSPRYSMFMRRVGTGISVLGLSKKNLGLLELAFPELNEQKKISHFLHLLDNKIKKQQEKIEKLEQFKKGMMQKIFSQELRFKDEDGGEFPEWKETTFGEVSISMQYGMNAAAKAFDGENKYIRITDIDEVTRRYIEDGKVSPLGKLSEEYRIIQGDILFARTGASTGKSYLYRESDGKIYYAGFLIRMRVGEGVDSRFVYYQTLLEEYEQWVKVMSMRSGQPGINAQEYSSYRFKLPSLKEQIRIAEFLNGFEKKIEKEREKLLDLEEQKKGIMRGIFV